MKRPDPTRRRMSDAGKAAVPEKVGGEDGIAENAKSNGSDDGKGTAPENEGVHLSPYFQIISVAPTVCVTVILNRFFKSRIC